MQTHLLEYQRKNRYAMPAPEVILWQKLRYRQFGTKFRRQYAMDNRIFDFYAPEVKLGIEIDGDSHFVDADRRVQEVASDEKLAVNGIMILRFYNSDVMQNLRGVMEKILEVVELRRRNPPLHLPPASQGGENGTFFPPPRRGDGQPRFPPPRRGGGEGGGSRATTVLSLLTAVLILFPTFVRAAVVQVASPEGSVAGVGSVVRVDIVVNTEDEDVNAIEGSLSYPANALVLQEIQDGSSVVSLWIKQPELPSSCVAVCTVSWSGLIPGGYAGRDGTIFSLLFTPRAAGKASIELHDVKVLRNDGRGSVAALKITNYQLPITNAPSPPSLVPSPAADTTPPEPFAPIITRDPALYDGAWVAVFAAVDKESGIDRYEIHEPGNSADAFVKAENPHRLGNAFPRGDVIVRAFDRAGNMREAKAALRPPPAGEAEFDNWLLVAMIGAAALALGWRLANRVARASA